MKKNPKNPWLDKQCIYKMLFIMKFTLFFTILGIMNVFAVNSYSQSGNVTLNLKNTKVEVVLNQIEKSSGYYFAYNQKLINVNRKVDILANNKAIKDVLHDLFKNTNTDYVVINHQIVLTNKADQVGFMQQNDQQNNQQQGKKVTGKVTDSNGGSLPGVSIIVKGTTNGAITDNNGNYTLSNIPENATLKFSFVGMKSQEIKIGTSTQINIIMTVSEIAIDEVVIIGYQTIKKKDVIGSVASISNKDLARSQVANIDQAFQGRTAGVIATQSSGQPGASVMVEIRGAGGFGSQGPLYIIDGIPSSNVSNLNPSDIESLDILKDASTAAIYGARGANGVVIVTTKRGKSGPVKVSFETSYGVQNVPKKFDMLNSRQYMDFVNASSIENGGTLVPQFDTQAKRDNLALINTNWQDLLFKKNAAVSNTTLTISGGNDNATFLLSANYRNEDGIVIDSYNKRLSLHLNSDFKAGKYLKFGESISLSQNQYRSITDNSGDQGNPITQALRLPPYLPPYDTDVNAVYHNAQNTNGWQTGVQGWGGNDTGNFLTSNLNDYKPKSFSFEGAFYGEIHFLKQLYYKLNVGLSYSPSFISNLTPRYYSGPYSSNSQVIESKDFVYGAGVIIENTLNYSDSFGKHNISAVGGISKQESLSERIGLSTFMPNDLLTNIDAGKNDIRRTVYGSTGNYRLTSSFGRVNYDFDGKYLASATIRRDGCTKFGPNKKFGIFPAFSAGWRISKEDFMAGLKAISDLKVYGSWGKLGSDNIGDFQYLPQVFVGSRNYNLGGNGTGNESVALGAEHNGLINQNIQWQANITTNIGVNLGLFNNMFTFNAEYYIKKTDKLLLAVPLPSTTGFGSITMNAGGIENKGIDLQLTYHKMVGDLQLDVTGNTSILKNNVTSLAGSNAIYSGIILPEGRQTTKTDVGQPIGSFWGYKYLGIAQSITGIPIIPGTRLGDCQYADLSGPDGKPDGKIDSYDQTYIGNPWPKAVYGLTINASYKGFDMNVFFQGVYGNDILNEEGGFWDDGYQGRYNAKTKVLDAWTPQNLSTSQHRLGNDNVNALVSTRMIEKGSYLKIKNLQLGYSLPSAILSKLAINKLRIFVSSSNLLTFTKYSGYDPEIGARYNSNLFRGIDQGGFPQARTFMCGLQVNF